MVVSWNRGTPKSSILIGFSLINQPFLGVPPWLWKPLYIYIYVNIHCWWVTIWSIPLYIPMTLHHLHRSAAPAQVPERPVPVVRVPERWDAAPGPGFFSHATRCDSMGSRFFGSLSFKEQTIYSHCPKFHSSHEIIWWTIQKTSRRLTFRKFVL